MTTAAQRRHWQAVAAMGCIVCGSPAEIAHCHGGSIVERMQEPKAKGKKLARYDWLVIPLCPFHHRISNAGLDMGVSAFEQYHGTQANHIDRIAEMTGLDLWTLAKTKR